MRCTARTVRRIRTMVRGASVDRRTAFNRATASAFLALLAVTLAAPPPFADTPHKAAAAAKGSAAAATALSQLLSKAVERGDAPAVVGLIVDRNGVLFEGAAGKLNDA